MNNQKGFTLIELVVVIVILGILAAFALPKFVNLQTDARRSTLNGLAGSMRSASALIHAKALATGTSAGGTVSVEGGTVVLDGSHTYPAASTTGIDAALQDLSGFDGSAGTFWPTGVTNSTNCNVTYTAGSPPTISVTDTNCD